MLTILDHLLSLNLVIWIFPLAFLIHDTEEIFTMERFRREKRDRFPAFARNIVAINTRQFIVAVAVLFALTLLASYLATRPPRQMDIFETSLAIFFVHVFGHIGQSVFLRGYNPGIITAILIVLPYSLYGFHRLFAAHLINDANLNTELLIAVVLFIPLILAVTQFGKLMIRR